MIKLTDVYKKYFQKSTVFLYPTLDIPKSSSIKPIQTYISCNDIYKAEDQKLICLYYTRDDQEFKVFEKNKLKGNLLFEKYIECEKDEEGEKGLYVFDFSSFNDSFNHFREGQYHKMDKIIRNHALTFYPTNSLRAEYLRSYLLPHLYYEIYSEILKCNIEDLKETGTLCGAPDFEKEHLQIKLKQNAESKPNNDDSVIRI